MTLAIEPMITAGRAGVYTGDDRWSIYTRDDSLAAHFEHTVAVTDERAPHPDRRGRPRLRRVLDAFWYD